MSERLLLVLGPRRNQAGDEQASGEQARDRAGESAQYTTQYQERELERERLLQNVKPPALLSSKLLLKLPRPAPSSSSEACARESTRERVRRWAKRGKEERERERARRRRRRTGLVCLLSHERRSQGEKAVVIPHHPVPELGPPGVFFSTQSRV